MDNRSRISGERSEPIASGESEEFLRAVAHAPAREPLPDLVGAVAGLPERYKIEQRLGKGGMGVVYLAFDTALERLVAVKVLNTTAHSPLGRAKARLLAEARIAAGIEHQRIARVYDVGEHQGAVFVSMEFVRGMSLRQRMESLPPAAVAQVLPLIEQIAEGLAALHAGNIIHRDLKPENVMLTQGGEVKLVDFGLARPMATLPEDDPASLSSQSNSAVRMGFSGTPGYMAPEQILNETFDARVDVFAFGVMLYELLAGRRPFVGDSPIAIMAATLHQPRQFEDAAWRAVPRAVRDLVERTLAEAPRRIANGSELLAAVRGLSKAGSAVAPATTVPDLRAPTEQVGRPRFTRRALWSAATIGAVVLLAAASIPAIMRLPHKLPPAPAGMVWVDVGRFTVGRTPEENKQECAALGSACDLKLMAREVPTATVYLPPFLLDQVEATNQDLVSTLNTLVGQLHLVEDEDSHQPRFVRFQKDIGHNDDLLVDLDLNQGGIAYAAKDGRFFTVKGRENLPAVQVSWYGARLFCATRGKGLPTEDQWEAATRGRANRRFPWGDRPLRPGGAALPGDGRIPTLGRIAAEAVSVNVGTSFQDITPEGVRDLGGNVSEWTDSVYVEGDRTRSAPAGSALSPRVIRGGSWAQSNTARSTSRNRVLPSTVGGNLGFRCAISHE